MTVTDGNRQRTTYSQVGLVKTPTGCERLLSVAASIDQMAYSATSTPHITPAREARNVTQVFLNYRSVDEPFGAAMLDEALSRRLGSSAVFFASKSIPLGSEWEAEMFKAVAGSDVLLVVMGRNWLRASDAHGDRRIDDPLDYVRREILMGRDLGKQVIPVLLGIARFPPEELPEPLQWLHDMQDIKINFRSAGPDIDRLVFKLCELVPALRDVEPGHTPQSAKFAAYGNGSVIQTEKLRFGGDFYAGPRLG
jgi:hypothetical protein